MPQPRTTKHTWAGGLAVHAHKKKLVWNMTSYSPRDTRGSATPSAHRQRVPCAAGLPPTNEARAVGCMGGWVSKHVKVRSLTLLCHRVPHACDVSYVQDGLGVPRKNPCKSTATTSWPPAATCTVFMNTAPTSTVSMLLSRPVRPKPAVPHGVERGVLT